MVGLRYLYVLALAVWVGGIVLLGALVAPATFQVLQAIVPDTGRALAGALFGTLIARFHYVQYAAGLVLLLTLAAMALLGPRPRSFAVRSAIIGVMLAVALYSGLVVLSQIDSVQQDIGTLASTLPEDDPRRQRFDGLHELASRLMMLNLAGGLVLIFWEARDS